MPSSSSHPNECQLSDDYERVRFIGWDMWQEYDMLERVEAFMERETVNTVEKYDILLENVARSYRDPNTAPLHTNHEMPLDPYMTADSVKRRLYAISYDYLYFRLFVFRTKGVLYNFRLHETTIDPAVYWDNGLECEQFAWFRLNGFWLYDKCWDVFQVKGLDTYARPYSAVDPFVPLGIDIQETSDICQSYYQPLKSS